MKYPVDKIRNICLIGHGGDGKTSLMEAMLYFTGAIDRLGKTYDGNTVSDFDPEEIKRKISISASIAPIEWRDHIINVIDTPGYFDFEAEVLQGINATASAVIVLSAKDGVNVGTEKAFKLTKKYRRPAFFFMSKVYEDHSDFYGTFEQIKKMCGKSACLINLPLEEDGVMVNGFVNIIDLKARKKVGDQIVEVPVPEEMQDKIEQYRDILNETIAETSDVMMEKYFAGEPYTEDEYKQAIKKGLKDATITPVLGGSSMTMEGLPSTLNFIIDYMPQPDVKPDEPTSAYIFKTVADPFVGKMSYFKILAGKITTGMTLYNSRIGEPEKISRLFVMKGKKQIEVQELGAGDIGVVTKLASVNTGDYLRAPGAKAALDAIEYPKPCYSRAIAPKTKGDEDKISQGLQKLAEEDKTIAYVNNAETHEQILSGLGDTHLDVIVSKLKSKYGVEVQLKEAKVPYREAIRKKVKQQGKHKKQSGGHGQYGDVWIEFEPHDGEEMIFEEKIFGGSVPKNFFPAVEKGLRECCEKGVLAHFPVVGLKATLVDGSYHDVDSSEMSFKMAASIAFKEGLPKASPTILEPIGNLAVIVPEKIMGDVIGDINKRRGQILGMEPAEEPGYQKVSATVPMSEMANYAIELRSMSRGRGSFDLVFDSYQDAPMNIAQKVIEAAKADGEDD